MQALAQPGEECSGTACARLSLSAATSSTNSTWPGSDLDGCVECICTCSMERRLIQDKLVLVLVVYHERDGDGPPGKRKPGGLGVHARTYGLHTYSQYLHGPYGVGAAEPRPGPSPCQDAVSGSWHLACAVPCRAVRAVPCCADALPVLGLPSTTARAGFNTDATAQEGTCVHEQPHYRPPRPSIVLIFILNPQLRRLYLVSSRSASLICSSLTSQPHPNNFLSFVHDSCSNTTLRRIEFVGPKATSWPQRQLTPPLHLLSPEAACTFFLHLHDRCSSSRNFTMPLEAGYSFSILATLISQDWTLFRLPYI